MINKTQKYLLLNYPTLWNIKLFPMLLILVGIHLFFGFIGYLSGAISFEDTYYRSSHMFDDGYVFLSTIFLSIFIFIGWLVFYMRHNALKNFYPKKSYQLYSEWLMILVIITGIALIPVSTALGAMTRVKATATEKECRKALDIIEKAKVLAPDESYYFNYNESNDGPIPIPSGKVIDLSDVNLNLYDLEYYEDGSLHINGYIGPSLLFYHHQNYYYYNYDYENKEEVKAKQRIQRVKGWLVEEQRDSVYQVMVEFNKLQKKHSLNINITPDQWIKRVYNPPFYPVNNSSAISNHKYNSYYSSYDRYYDYDADSSSIYVITDVAGDTVMRGDEATTSAFIEAHTNDIPYLQINELEAAYKHILYTHTDNEDLCNMLLIILCISVSLSIFVFSYRVTSGKAWLIAFVASGVLFFLILFVGVLVGDSSHDFETGVIFILTFWLTLFATLFIYLVYKIVGSGVKGYSKAPMNMFLWLIPCIIPILFFNGVYFYEIHDTYYHVSDEAIKAMFWIDILFMIIAMFPISAFVIRWKGIAEE